MTVSTQFNFFQKVLVYRKCGQSSF